MGVAASRIDRDRLRRDLENLISPYYGRPLGEIALTPLLNDALAIVRRHRMRLPSNLALLLKTIIITEGLGRASIPTFVSSASSSLTRTGFFSSSIRRRAGCES